jgi:hypothetical protein
MQPSLSLFDRRVRNLFLALILSGAALATRADEPPVCDPAAPSEQCIPGGDLPTEVDPWEDDLPGKSAAAGDVAVGASTPGGWRALLDRLLAGARRLAGLGLSELCLEPSFLGHTQP